MASTDAAQSLIALIETHMQAHVGAASWCVAYSGGLDSSVLLDVLARQSSQGPRLRALHVHHGLAAQADAWVAHCVDTCARLNVELRILRVQLPPDADEALAREARHAALSAALLPGEVLCMAHHRGDQAETLLFRLLRGSGLRGLGGMAGVRPLGVGVLCRPLLNVPRSLLREYAERMSLDWVEDPSNGDPRFARARLRHEVLPYLARDWPQVEAVLARSAGHLREAQSLLEDLAELDLQGACQGAPAFLGAALPSLAVAPLSTLSVARRHNALQHFLAPLTLLPDTRHWVGLEMLFSARQDAQPVWSLAQGELRRSGGRLWWLSGDWLRQPELPPVWVDPALPLQLPGNGCLVFQGDAPSGPLQVVYRASVSAFDGLSGHRLKRWLQAAAVPSFVRERLPMVYQAGKLLAVAGVEAAQESAAPWRLCWQPPC